jgi:aldehyde dehydrogenase (NAD+)
MARDVAVHESNYIGGQWVEPETDGVVERHSPAEPGTVVSAFPSSDRDVAGEAIAAAVDAQDAWAATSAHERGAYLRDAAAYVDDHRAELTDLIAREMGKPVAIAAGEVQRTVDLCRYFAEVARDYDGTTTPSASDDTLTYTTREPWGTVGLITPWNYPIAIPTWKLAPALVAGNTVVLKPSSLSPAVTSVLVEALDHAGLPGGVVNFVVGPGSEVGDELANNPDVDVVSFTGSSEAGHYVYQDATDDGKRVQTEMGGKNPLIVDETADLGMAAELTVGGGFAATGQSCTATSRVLVFEDVYEDYLDALTAATRDLVVGDPLDESVTVGPKADADGYEKVLRYLDVARDEGATVHYGGQPLDPAGVPDGHFVEPAILTGVEADMRVMQEEIFGPVVGVMPVSGYEEALDVANGVDFGLSASVCTNRLDHAKRFSRDVEAGVVKVNQTTTGVEMQLPFGGMKRSSSETYKEQGRQALDFYTHEKAVYLTHFDGE